MLTQAQVDRFVNEGFVRLPGAFPRELAAECRALLSERTGLDLSAPTTWIRPLVRIPTCSDEPFRRVMTAPRLHAAFDQLVGAGRWARRSSVGTFPIRFPHPDDPGDTGWHVEGSFRPECSVWPWVNLRSRGRALLLLFLFSDVGPDDAPTRMKVGSHLDVPPILAPMGEDGMSGLSLARALERAGLLDSPRRPTALATGSAGDVYLCHPFLVHAAQRHRGSTPRFLGQPCLESSAPLDLDRADKDYFPVERAIRLGLHRAG